jgi:hypothetical protein
VFFGRNLSRSDRRNPDRSECQPLLIVCPFLCSSPLAEAPHKWKRRPAWAGSLRTRVSYFTAGGAEWENFAGAPDRAIATRSPVPATAVCMASSRLALTSRRWIDPLPSPLPSRPRVPSFSLRCAREVRRPNSVGRLRSWPDQSRCAAGAGGSRGVSAADGGRDRYRCLNCIVASTTIQMSFCPVFLQRRLARSGALHPE